MKLHKKVKVPAASKIASVAKCDFPLRMHLVGSTLTKIPPLDVSGHHGSRETAFFAEIVRSFEKQLGWKSSCLVRGEKCRDSSWCEEVGYKTIDPISSS